jgi:5-(carboxyamino)imidazole ribonucleotide synthase
MANVGLAPGSWLGLLGGGQLGRMFVHAAQRLGYKVLVLEPEADCPAAQAADAAIDAEYTDAAALREIARRCAAATIEFENVPAAALVSLAAHIPAYPAAAAVAVAQNRIAEKRLFASCNARVAPHRLIERATDIEDIDASLLPGILKTCTLGYDGLGQRRVGTIEAAHTAWHELGGVACVLEKQLPLATEVSVIVARAKDGSAVAFPVAENQHRGGILALTILPARIDPELAQRARESALTIARVLDYVGVLCVEFFVLSDGSLVANEMAPRPHNSGHATIEACTTSQFEQQVRVAAGLPLGDVTQLSPAVMVNVLGDVWGNDHAVREPDWAAVAALPGAKLHLYGKRAARRGRKMGHVTCLAATHAQALERANRVALCLGIEPFA